VSTIIGIGIVISIVLAGLVIGLCAEWIERRIRMSMETTEEFVLGLAYHLLHDIRSRDAAIRADERAKVLEKAAKLAPHDPDCTIASPGVDQECCDECPRVRIRALASKGTKSDD
jgi:hypothetical protein